MFLLKKKQSLVVILCQHINIEEEEEESLFNRKYMVWETSIKTTYGRWHRGHPFDSSVIM